MELRQIRQQKGITQAQMAEKLGVSRPTYIQIERGEKELTVSQARTIGELFGLHKKSEYKKQPVRNKSMQKGIKFDAQKFKEVLLYILEKVGAKPNIGETALYKLLYFIDFDFYEKYGRSLTGTTYIKNHHGPTPKQFKPVTDDMIREGELERVTSRYFQYDQKKYLPHRRANLEFFSATEKEHIDEILVRLSDKNARDLRAYSHGDHPWAVSEEQKEIDYRLVFDRMPPYTEHDYEAEFMQAGANDVFGSLPPMSKEEYDYYMSLPDTRDKK